MRVLFASNGHGEAAIADAIASEVLALVPQAQLDHLALVGDRRSEVMREVGPRRPMPSGGLIAMGNLRHIAADVGAGLIGLTREQHRFLRAARGAYAAAVAIGDAYALWMALVTRAPAVFVGTAKSVNVAPYGRFEERLLRRAAVCFVRDEPTAQRLREHGVDAHAANVIADLGASGDDRLAEPAVKGFQPALALFPGSRQSAYEDARFLLAVTAGLAADPARAALGAVVSVARGLDAQRVAQTARGDGWEVRALNDPLVPFALRRDGREVVRAWRGALGPLLARTVLVLGQAGTANETAAAAGVPVIAFERSGDRKTGWYRRRQRGLLGEAMSVLPGDLGDAVAGVAALLADPARRARMGEAGRVRMGAAGAARRIAACVASFGVRG